MKKGLLLLVLLPLAGCSGGEADVSKQEEQNFKNPIAGKPPTAEQMKSKAPGFIGKPSGSSSSAGSSPSSPPPGPPTGG